MDCDSGLNDYIDNTDKDFTFLPTYLKLRSPWWIYNWVSATEDHNSFSYILIMVVAMLTKLVMEINEICSRVIRQIFLWWKFSIFIL